MINGDLKVSEKQFFECIEDLGKFVAIPSVSHPESPYFNMLTLSDAAHFVSKRLQDLDFEVRLVKVDESAPYVIAQRIVDIALPTLLFYAHYDVQPVEEDKWKSKPFVVEERDGRLYGRGASDDKAGLMAIITALRVYKESGKPIPVNIKVLSEGEEEYGSNHMSALLDQEAATLHAHTMVVLDGLSKDVSTGTLTSACRGIVNLTLQVNALTQPKHSGIACLAPCPALALACLVSSLQAPEKISGFMDDAEQMPQDERMIYRQRTQTPDSYKSEMGMVGGSLRGDPETSVYERIVETPSITIININAGKPNGGNSIQESARCEIGIRLTPGQDPDRIGQVVKKHLESQKVLWNLPIDVQVKEGCRAWKADLTKPFSTEFLKSLEKNFPKVGAIPCGGALPLLYELQHAFKKKGLPDMDMMVPGMEDPDSNAHSHNESLSIELLRNTINTVLSFINGSSTLKVGKS